MSARDGERPGLTVRRSRRHTSAPVSLWRRNRTDTNRGRAVVVAESGAVFSVGFERNTCDADSRIALTVKDDETGARFMLRLSLAAWRDVVARADAQARGSRGQS